jgi:microcystin-dependent protein
MINFNFPAYDTAPDIIGALRNITDKISSQCSTKSQDYPVGSLFITTKPDNPNTILGTNFTWQKYNQGRVLVGVSTTDTDFQLGNTGGSKTETLTVNNFSTHNHTFNIGSTNNGTHDHSDRWNTSNNYYYQGGGNNGGSVISQSQENINVSTNGNHSHSFSATTSSQGSNTSHTNLMPTIARYIYRRTA